LTAKLIESIGRQTSTKLLADLDEECEKVVTHDGKCSVNLLKGPFGVFPAVEPKTASSPLTASLDIPAEQPAEAPGPVFDFDEDDALVENIPRDIDIGLIDSFDHDILFTSTDRSLNFDLLDPALLDLAPPDKISDGHFSALLDSDILPQDAMDVTLSPRTVGQLELPSPPSLYMNPGYSNTNGAAIPEHAQPLLCYYKQCIDHTGKAFKPKRRSPGELLFLPCALETFAELSLWNTTSSARSALLHAVLANSAFQADRAALCQTKWRDIAVRHQAQAGRYLRDALLRETSGPSQVAYKDLLMAILAVAMISVSIRQCEIGVDVQCRILILQY
jgi:arginine metabolism regulation protein II